MIRQAIAKVVEGKDLTQEEMMAAVEDIMDGRATAAQIASLATALRMKGETVVELCAAARAIRRRAVKVEARSRVVLDTCGTGGDRANTFNISTATAFVVAGAGVTVAKHGNRAVSSGCGSADVLMALGVKVDVGLEVVEECLQELGIGFLFAPNMHPAMRHAAGPRSEMGIRTIFNMLGPLTNPAGATCQLLGVYDPKLTEPFAAVLRELGTKRAFVVHGMDGLDEASVSSETRVSELRDGRISTYNLDPRPFVGGFYPLEELKGGAPELNARILRGILEGQDGAPRKAVELNSGLSLLAAGEAGDMAQALELAAHSIRSGAALAKLEALIERTRS
ncbi:MAG: anthranilate phosphoribosyltransferase [Thermodesulfobacteriota bacterium]